MVFSAAAGPQGRRSLWRGLKALAPTPRFHPLRLMQRNVSVIGVNLGRMEGLKAPLRSQLEKIFQPYSEERIRPVIGKRFPP
jgi:NADPH:quinone reductase-like Zn-dependent oxidoreductase